MTKGFPSKFDLLHTGEEFLRSKSIEAIVANEDLSEHAAMIESVMDLLNAYIVGQPTAKDAAELAIKCLGIRQANAIASALKLVLSGYYQNAALIERDLLETVFLVQYFKLNPAMISVWLNCEESKRNQQFGAVIIRRALDDKDGFKERKREAAYKLLCNLGGHASPQGFRMLTPIAGGDAHFGPFFEQTSLVAVLSELAKIAVEIGSSFNGLFKATNTSEREIKISFFETSGKWFERFFGKAYDPAPVEDLKAILAKLGDLTNPDLKP